MRRRSARGFTLVELMVVITIMGIVLVIGVPSFRSTMQSNRVATSSNELLGSISLARGDAITSTRTAGICAANAAGTACTATTDWTNGWLVWRNNNDDFGYQAGTDDLLRYVQSRNGMTVTVPVSSNTAVGNMLVFDARGRAIGTASGTPRSLSMRPTDCTAGRPFLRTLALSALGQVTTTKGNCT